MQFFKTPKIDFIGKRYVSFTISIILIIIGICAIAIKGPNYGIDFSGGILMQFSFDKEIQMDVIRKGLSEQQGLNFEFQTQVKHFLFIILIFHNSFSTKPIKPPPFHLLSHNRPSTPSNVNFT